MGQYLGETDTRQSGGFGLIDAHGSALSEVDFMDCRGAVWGEGERRHLSWSW